MAHVLKHIRFVVTGIDWVGSVRMHATHNLGFPGGWGDNRHDAFGIDSYSRA